MCLLILYWFRLVNGYEQLGQFCFFPFIGRKGKKSEIPSLVFIFVPCRIHEIWHLRTRFVLHFYYLIAMCTGVIMHWTQTFLWSRPVTFREHLAWRTSEFCALRKHSCKLMKTICLNGLIVQGTLSMQIPLTGFPAPYSTSHSFVKWKLVKIMILRPWKVSLICSSELSKAD